MNTTELVEWVKGRLGYPVFNVEVPDTTIESCIDDALNEVLPWYNKTKLVTMYLGNNSCIDLSEYNILDVVNVYSADKKSGNFENEFFSDRRVSNLMNSQLELMLLNQTIGYFKDNMSFMFQDDKLYIDTGYPVSTNITVEYIPKIDSVEEITDRYYLNYVKEFTLAFTREVLGEIRGKFRVSNSPTELDYDHQYDKSTTELERLRQAIRDEYLDNSIID